MLRELKAKDADELGGFGWGYNGGGTSRTAATVLADALGMPEKAGLVGPSRRARYTGSARLCLGLTVCREVVPRLRSPATTAMRSWMERPDRSREGTTRVSPSRR
ncbi:hypothetical protein GCM10010211_84080 [Streptomyces albospinus]|uniref:Uncharacterized protein n=1 Tax=Streptomyces albospinus TaxID=285515 RepID=A0ABQ2VSF5_9ACTN|nr:hypothetical protein GCM10010211_84080 [Streptomyces albospinus]